MKISKALVFDIKRFAIHDESGLRTTVFFKGCPLRCLWCQNPEGLNTQRQVIYFKNKCIHCRCCQQFKEQINYQNDRPYFQNHQDFDQVIKTCPSGAIQYDSQEYTLDKLMNKIKEDEVFFQHGGGVTFSGGEPFMQGEFLIKILKRCQKEKIHTAIETSLYTDLENVQKALPYLDQIYCDCKLYDENLHKQYTGVSNEKVLKNIAYLLQSNKKEHVIVRTPLIPTMTASFENISSISRFLVSCYGDVHYEILNYNPLAQSKYAYLDMEYCFKENPKMYSSEKMQEFYDCAKQNGIKNLVID